MKTNYLILLLILVSIFALGCTVESNSSTTPNTNNMNSLDETETQEPVEPESYYAGDRVEIGSFAYTINSYYTTSEIGEDFMGTFLGEKADGIFLVLDVTIENIVKESKTLWGDNIKVIDDQGRTFEHDTMAEISLEDGEGFSFEQIQPGLPKTGKVVFDVPKDISGMVMIESENMWSDDVVYIYWTEK